jgi:hypothetical protein
MGIKDIAEGEIIVTFKNPDVIIPGMDNLNRLAAGKDLAKKGYVQTGKRIEDIAAWSGINLQETEFLAEIPEGIVLRIHTDHGRLKNVSSCFVALGGGIDPAPFDFHVSFS